MTSLIRRAAATRIVQPHASHVLTLRKKTTSIDIYHEATMSTSSPSKRRKKNDSSVQPVRGLDYFFAKQQAAADRNGGPAVAADTTTAAARVTVASGEDAQREENLDVQLTDEELARKLQEEWDAEERELEIRNGTGTSASAAAPLQPQQEHVATEAEDQGLVKKDQETRTTSAATLSLQSTATEEDTVSVSIPFDESPLTFDPAKYIPELQKHWASNGGGQATYALLTRCFVLVNSTTSRIKIVDTLVNLLRTIIEGDPTSLLPAVWLATNAISPPYIDLELGIGGSVISKALRKVCGLDNAGLKALYNKYGDAGDVAFEAKKRQSFTLKKPKPLTIKGVFDNLVKIANSKGTGSVDVKGRIVEKLLQDARGAEESRYIVRTLVQHVCVTITFDSFLEGYLTSVSASHRRCQNDYAHCTFTSLPALSTTGCSIPYQGPGRAPAAQERGADRAVSQGRGDHQGVFRQATKL